MAPPFCLNTENRNTRIIKNQETVNQKSVNKTLPTHGVSILSLKSRSSRIGHHRVNNSISRIGHQESVITRVINSVSQDSVIKNRSSLGSSIRQNRIHSLVMSNGKFSNVTYFIAKGDVSPVVLPFHSLFLSAFPATESSPQARAPQGRTKPRPGLLKPRSCFQGRESGWT